MDFARNGLGEIEADLSSEEAFLAIADGGALFIISEIGLSVRFNFNGDSWLYSAECSPGCSQVVFDVDNRTVTLDDFTMEPSFSDESMATDFLTVSGVLNWVAEDEDPNAPQLTNFKVSEKLTPQLYESNSEEGDLVWRDSIAYDERYLVFQKSGVTVEFVYNELLGNCYKRQVLGGQAQQLTSNGGSIFVPLTQYGLDVSSLTDGKSILTPTTLVASNLKPICE